jgi:hypothetical protein
MDFRQVVLGIVLFLIFWAFAAGYFEFLGNIAWFVGALFISFLPWLFEMGRKGPKPPQQIKDLWMFATVFLVVATFILSFAGSFIGVTADTSTVVSLWLIIFGGGWIMHGWLTKHGISGLLGIIWIFAVLIGFTSYSQLALILLLTFVLNGVFAKKSR